MKSALAIVGSAIFVLAMCADAAEVKELGRSPEVLERVRASGASPKAAAFGDALGLSTGETLQPAKVTGKSRARDVVRYRQEYRGIPVWGREIVVERERNGRITRLGGHVVTGLARDIHNTRPALGMDEVVEAMKARVRVAFGAAEPVFTAAKGELVIYAPRDGAAVLSYAVSILADSRDGGHPSRPVFLVDASSGEVLFQYDALAHQQQVCGAGCTPLDVTGISANLQTWQYYSVAIPQDVQPATTMTVRTTGGSGDADLYVRKGSQPTLNAFDCRPYINGNAETCSVAVSGGEVWHFGLYAYSAFSGVALRADIQAPLEQVGSGPGGNEKVGLYYYGREYDTLDVASNANQCTMVNSNVKTVHLHNGASGTAAFVYDKINADCYNASDYANGAYSALNDAHDFGSIVFDMYNAYLAEPPLTFQLTMRVHYSSNYENAFWDGATMTFGDGATYFYPLVSLDVAAHEISHGFTEQHSGLLYAGQPGGINESFSDIAGEAAEYFMRGSADFLVGAQIVKYDGFLRNMMDPPSDGASIDNLADYNDILDVHYSSGIYNKAFYLLATTAGWNVRDAFLVFANANRYCWTPDTGFVDGAQCVVDEAGNLGRPVHDVANAFAGVGITGLDLGLIPGTPVLSVTSTTSTGIVLSWPDVANESAYSLRRSLSASANLDNSLEIARLAADTTTYTDSNLKSATNYYYQLVAINGSAESASAVVGAKTLLPPGC